MQAFCPASTSKSSPSNNVAAVANGQIVNLNIHFKTANNTDSSYTFALVLLQYDLFSVNGPGVVLSGPHFFQHREMYHVYGLDFPFLMASIPDHLSDRSEWYRRFGYFRLITFQGD